MAQYGDPGYDATTARFDILRKRLQEQKAQAGSEQEDALKRKFASQGLLNSGAYLKAQENQGNQLEQDTQKGFEDIQMQEAQERQRQADIKQAQEYQTSERESSQQFNAGQMDKQLDLSRRELDENIKTNRLNAMVAFKNAGINEGDFDRINSQLSEFYGMVSIGPDGTITYKPNSEQRAARQSGDAADSYKYAQNQFNRMGSFLGTQVGNRQNRVEAVISQLIGRGYTEQQARDLAEKTVPR